MFIKQIHNESLGNSSYLVGSEEAKVCAVVDPLRDVDTCLREAANLGAEIVYSLETHVHNDFISGSRELAALTGATVGSSAAGGLLFDHRPLRKGESIELGEVRLEVIATPGHTPEHISFLVTDTAAGGGPQGLFSGGALLVGRVARSDLLGKQLAPFLGRWFHRTILEELQPLDDEVAVYPTHGAGSFCLVTPSGYSTTTSTIGQERLTNPFFQAASEADFLEMALSDMPSFPTYYKRMANINRRGPRILGSLPVLYPLAPREVWVRAQSGEIAVDARSAAEFATSHVPGAYCVPFGGSFGTWVGWLVEEGRPLLLINEDLSNNEEIVRQLIRLGYDDLQGYLEGGMESWEKARLPVARLQTLSIDDLHAAIGRGASPTPLDVRFDHEWRLGHIPGALHVELGELPEHLDGLHRDRSYATVCAAGVRAATAASILEREGFQDVSLVVGGTETWRQAEYPLEVEES